MKSRLIERDNVTYQEIGQPGWTREDLEHELEMFLHTYENRPVRDNQGGMTSAHLFPTWFFCRIFQPRYIIESGIWKGLGTWMFEQACPTANIICLDPVMENRQYVSPSAEYSRQDFSLKNWDFIADGDRARTLCFFDDHQGAHRLRQAYNLGFTHILYEDNYNDGRGHEGVFPPPYEGENISPKSALAGLNDNLATWIHQHAHTYYEFPPIYSAADSTRGYEWANVSREEYIAMTPPPLFNEYEEQYRTFHEEAAGYTWISYIKLGE